MKKLIIPAILSKTREDYLAKINAVEGLVQRVHIDIMDGFFVPNKTISLSIVSKVPTPLQKEAHFMVQAPWKHASRAAQAGIHTFIFHIESCPREKHVQETLTRIKEKGMHASIAINPNTSVQKTFPYLSQLEHVLLMTVQPGFGGQPFLHSVLKKIQTLHRHNPSVCIEVDGGINPRTLPLASHAGATYFVMGNAIYARPDTKNAIKEYQKRASH